MDNIELKEFQPVPFELIAELRSQLAAIQEQNRVIMAMINDEHVERMSNEYLDLDKTAEVMGCKTKTLERLRKKGEFPYSQYGKKIVVRRSDIDAFLELHRKNRDFRERVRNNWAEELPLDMEQETGGENEDGLEG